MFRWGQGHHWQLDKARLERVQAGLKGIRCLALYGLVRPGCETALVSLLHDDQVSCVDRSTKTIRVKGMMVLLLLGWRHELGHRNSLMLYLLLLVKLDVVDSGLGD